MRCLKSVAGRWLVGLCVPLIASFAVVTSSVITAQASYRSLELRAHDQQAFYHCVTGDNQYGNSANPCFYTLYSVTNEDGWWWCADTYGCPLDVICTVAPGPQSLYGGRVIDAWFDYNHNYISSSSDCISTVFANPWPYQDVYGP
jgi:hypothetical protein